MSLVRGTVFGGMLAVVLVLGAGCEDHSSLAVPATTTAFPTATTPATSSETTSSETTSSETPALPDPSNGKGTATVESSTNPESRTPASEPIAEEGPEAADPQPAKPFFPPGRLDLSFDDLKFEMEKNDEFKRALITPRIESLKGHTISIRGYIHPSSAFQSTGITKFIFVRDNQECCFGPGAMLYDCIIVETAPGKSANFGVYPIKVEGVFDIDVYKIGDRIMGIYRLKNAAVR